MRTPPLLISTALRTAPLILLDRNDLIVFSWSSDLIKTSRSNLLTAAVRPAAPSCNKSFILNTPDAWSEVDCFLANVSTNVKKLITIS